MTDQYVQAEPITAKEFFDSLVPVPPDDTCRTCKFWARYHLGEWFGNCNNGDETKLFSSGNSIIHYPETFGCKFHRPKEAA